MHLLDKDWTVSCSWQWTNKHHMDLQQDHIKCESLDSSFHFQFEQLLSLWAAYGIVQGFLKLVWSTCIGIGPLSNLEKIYSFHAGHFLLDKEVKKKKVWVPWNMVNKECLCLRWGASPAAPWARLVWRETLIDFQLLPPNVLLANGDRFPGNLTLVL